jgi:hypothetical protein
MKKIIHTNALAVGFLLSFGCLPAQDKALQLDSLPAKLPRQWSVYRVRAGSRRRLRSLQTGFRQSRRDRQRAQSAQHCTGSLIEKTLGKPYTRILKEKVFDKCGMTQSGSLVAGQQLGRCAKGYTREGEVLTEARFLDPAVFQGAGSVYSTAEDLFMFDQALYSNALVSKKSRDLMFGSSTGYGYGWFIRQIPGVGKVVYHEGGIPGYNGVLFRAVERNYSVVLLSNHDADGAGMQPLTKSIIGVLMQKQ